MNIDFARTRYISSSETSDKSCKVQLGKLKDIDLYSPLELYLLNNPEWIAQIDPTVDISSDMVCTYNELVAVLDYFSVDISDTSWYTCVDHTISLNYIPETISMPTKDISEVDYYDDTLPFIPARVNGFSECAICTDSSDETTSFQLFGTAEMNLHKRCLYRLIAAIQDILTGVEPTIASKSI